HFPFLVTFRFPFPYPFTFRFRFHFHFRFWCQRRPPALIEPRSLSSRRRGLGAGDATLSREIHALEPAQPKRNPRLSPYAPTRFAAWLIDRARHGCCRVPFGRPISARKRTSLTPATPNL